MRKLVFPSHFLWGGASAAEQVEGKGVTDKGKTVWDALYAREPEQFFDQIGPDLTCDFTRHYKEDIARFAQMKINSLRIGISWARLFPDGKTLNKEAVQLYHDIIDCAGAHKIKLLVSLFHFDMPLWAANLGGWESAEVIARFVAFADFVFAHFGPKVKYFVTMNEPSVPVLYGYQNQQHWPGIIDNNKCFGQWWGTLLAHSRVSKLFNQKYKKRVQNLSGAGVVAIVAPAIAGTGTNVSSQDAKAASIFNLIHNDMWLLPMVKGVIPPALFQLLNKAQIKISFPPQERAEIEATRIDFLGANFYAPGRVQARTTACDNIEKQGILEAFYQPFRWKKARFNVFRGWEIYPQAIYQAAMVIKNQLGNIPFMITENGIGVENEQLYRDQKTGEIADDYRIAFVAEHLQWLHKAIEEGANCFGYHMWAITDNWSWKNAFKNRYGFIEINLSNQSRRFKKSAWWFQKVIENNGFNTGYPRIEETIDLTKVKFTKSK